jgi:hypothetical protein
MTFKLTVVFQISGRIESESVPGLRAEVSSRRPDVLDLREVTLVDLAVVRFLIACEAQGVSVVHCSRYIREWMDREGSAARRS